MLKSYGDAAVAERLRTARTAAGFKSGREAAVSAGWSPNTYKAHEGGRRALTEEDAAKYADAFRVTPKWLLSGVGPAPLEPKYEGSVEFPPYGPDDPQSLWQSARRKEANFTANRIHVARLLAGFATASDACRYFKFVRPTYGGHEYGQEPVPVPWLAIYAAAFGVREEWLRTGKPPSDLPTEVTEAVREAEETADWGELPEGIAYRSWNIGRLGRMLTRLADPSRRGSLAHVGGLRRRLNAERPRSAIPGHEFLVLETGGPEPSNRELWGIPCSFVGGDHAADPATVAVVYCGREVDGLARIGDRIIVDLSHPQEMSGLLVLVDPTGDVRLGDPRGIEQRPGQEEPVHARVIAVVRKAS